MFIDLPDGLRFTCCWVFIGPSRPIVKTIGPLLGVDIYRQFLPVSPSSSEAAPVLFVVPRELARVFCHFYAFWDDIPVIYYSYRKEIRSHFQI
jgi:hypothetical protein